MKGSIILPLVQILLIIIISTLLSLGTYLFMFNNSYGPIAYLSFGTFLSQLPALLLNIFPIVVLISVVLSLVNTLKTPANRGFAALFTLLTASIIYYSGYTGLYLLNKNSTPTPIENVSHLYKEKINPLADSKLFIKSNYTAIEIQTHTDNSSVNIFTDTEFKSETNSLNSDLNQSISIQPENPYFSEVFNPPKLFQDL
ncbi:MAG: hypothetical protein PF693_03635, partial [Spirochaetia bacterium]|nr:hypothetical protein [Spirochaetia bacterium]